MSNENTLMHLLFPGTRQRVLAVLLLEPNQSFHLRELARLGRSHAGTLGRELEKLAEAGLVMRTELGNQVRFQANTRCPLYGELASIFRKTHGAAGVLRDGLVPLGSKARLAVVFGSVARGTQSGGSDVDLLVVGDLKFSTLVKLLHPLQEILGREINPVLYSAEEFRERARNGDGFVKNVTSQPVLFVKGDANDLAELAGDPTPPSARS